MKENFPNPISTGTQMSITGFYYDFVSYMVENYSAPHHRPNPRLPHRLHAPVTFSNPPPCPDKIRLIAGAFFIVSLSIFHCNIRYFCKFAIKISKLSDG